MALELGIISSVITLADAAFVSCKALHDVIKGVQHAPEELLYLKTDLDEVGRTLVSFMELERSTGAHENAGYRAALQRSMEELRPCLEELGNTCDSFRASLDKMFRHSTVDRMSNRDRFGFQFQQGSIERFRTRLGSYKNTLSVALGLASLTATSSNAQDIGSLEKLLVSTNNTLVLQLKDVEKELNNIATSSRSYVNTGSESDANVATEAELRQQKTTLEACTEVCASASQGIRVKRAEAFDDSKQLIGNIGQGGTGKTNVDIGELIGRDRSRQVAGNTDGEFALAFLK